MAISPTWNAKIFLSNPVQLNSLPTSINFINPINHINLLHTLSLPVNYKRAVEKTNFVDQIRIFCRSGHGGAGSKHFLRTKYNALAGPDGGDGGRGAHIILRGNKNLWTLLHLRYYKNVLAEDGENGSGKNCSG